MRKGSGVDDHPVVNDEPVQFVDQFALVVRLEKLEAVARKVFLQFDQNLLEAFQPIDIHFTLSCEIEVRAIEDQDVHAQKDFDVYRL